MTERTNHFPISQSRAFKPLAIAFGAAHGAVDIGATEIEVRFGVMFRAHMPRAAVRGATPGGRAFLSRGAHGWRGRWLVNGSGKGLVTITIDPAARAWVMGVPVRLRELTVSVDDPEGLIAALGG